MVSDDRRRSIRASSLVYCIIRIFITRIGDSARAKKAGWQKEMDKVTDQVQGHFEGGAAYSRQG